MCIENKLRIYWLNLDVSLAGISFPLFIGGQVSRIRSGSIQISHTRRFTICSFYIRLELHFDLYLGPMFLWASIRAGLRSTNNMCLGSHTLVTYGFPILWIKEALSEGIFPSGPTSCYFPVKFALQDFYRIISYRIESYESNGFRRKKFIGSQSYTNPLKIL
jgi:hypothetical protein